jgi:hypothetical protein
MIRFTPVAIVAALAIAAAPSPAPGPSSRPTPATSPRASRCADVFVFPTLPPSTFVRGTIAGTTRVRLLCLPF